MTDRIKRLKKLMAVQEQIKALHEMRHAQHLALAAEAAREAEDIAARAGEGTLMSTLFPDLYSKRTEKARWRETKARDLAAGEVQKIAAETVRGSMVERQYRAARRDDERTRADIERLERIARTPKV